MPSDEIIPLRSWDTALSMRKTVLDAALRFDDVMDIQRLHSSLEQLYEIGNWRQLGARLRVNVEGYLEYHIPQSYSDARPAFIFTNTRHQMTVKAHLLGSRLPEATGQPQVFSSPEEFTPLVRSPNTPRNLDDWIYADNPQLYVHTVSFDDATIITVTFPHTLADVMGIGVFFRAWSYVLNGQETDVMAIEGLQSDPLSQLAERTPPEKYTYFDRILSKLDLLVFAGWRLLDSLWYRQEERRTICLPAGYLRDMRTKAQEVVTASCVRGCPGPTPFVSESDILVAWWARALSSALDLSPGQLISINNALNLRTSLHENFSPENSAYIGNAVSMTPTFVHARELHEESLGQTAWRIRQSVFQQRMPEQVEAVTALLKQTMEKSGYLALVGDPRMILLCCSNWHRAGLYNVNFSAAVTASGKPLSQRTNGLGEPSYVNGVLHSGLSFRNTFAVTGRDATGNWWLNGVLRTDVWERIERELEAMQYGVEA